MNCCFAASLYSLSLTFVGTHPFAPTRCLVGGELVHSLYSSRRCSRQISLPPHRSVVFHTAGQSRNSAAGPAFLFTMSALGLVCAQNHYLMVVASHHFGPTADIRRGSSRCLAGYSTRPHHRSQGRPRCPGPSNFCKDQFPPLPSRLGGAVKLVVTGTL